MEPATHQSDLDRAALPLTELTGIISGIAATGAIYNLFKSIGAADEGAKEPSWIVILLFITCIVTVIRFYLGNFRHLDELYRGGQGKLHSVQLRASAGKSLAADFSAITIQSLLTVALAYFLDSPPVFVASYSILLLFDMCWFFFFHGGDHDRASAWAFNNFIFGVISLAGSILLFFAPLTEGYKQLTVGIFVGLTLINAGIDFRQQFNFYFPTYKRPRIVFLAAPFTDERDEEGIVGDELRGAILKIIGYFRSKGYIVRSAHEREHFGSQLHKPAPALRNDFDWLKGCGVVVAIMKGDQPSPGVQMELGAAVILGKPVVQIVFPEANIPYLNRAFEDNDFRKEGIFHVIRGEITSTTLDQLGMKVDELCN